MITVKAFLLFLAVTSLNDAYTNYQELTRQLDYQIEWIDQDGTSKLSRSEAVKHLNLLTDQMNSPVYSVRHTSAWKNDQCFRIIHISSEEKELRIFFQCVKKQDNRRVVTKVKITQL